MAEVEGDPKRVLNSGLLRYREDRKSLPLEGKAARSAE